MSGQGAGFRRRLLWAAGSMLAVGAGLLLHPGSRAWILDSRPVAAAMLVWLAARAESPICPLLEAHQGLNELIRTAAASSELYPRVRRVAADDAGLELWDSPLGGWWFPRDTSKDNIVFALAQYQVTAYPGLRVRPGDVVLDCGGYVGDWAHWALRAGAARVIVFEPGSAQLECIRRNLAEPIRQGRVTLIPKGVWDQPGRLNLRIVPDNPAANSVTEAAQPGGESIELTTIDAVVEELGLTRVNAIKMDVEGAEVRALRGARRTLERFRPALAVATEHTADMVQNNRDVIGVMREIAPRYRVRCGYCSLRNNRSLIVPETLYFDPD